MHLISIINKPLKFLMSFRQYIHFHMHAMKVKFNAGMRKKVEQMERVIKLVRRYPKGTTTGASLSVAKTDARR